MTSVEAAALDRPMNSTALGIAVFSATSFLSALLLFCIEPLFSKMVLPVLGGTAAVWSVATVVFQGLLLAGYVYAWFIMTRLSLSNALRVHAGLLVAATFCLPVAMSKMFGEPPPHGIALWLIGLFLASIGLPFFAVAANAPLLQAWFSRTAHRHAGDPYFLYRASNLGSFAVLLAYPFLIEPVWGLAAHLQVNLSGVYHLWPDSRYGLALRFDVINLFDSLYEIQDGSNLGAGPAQWGPGRGFFAGVEQSF